MKNPILILLVLVLFTLLIVEKTTPVKVEEFGQLKVNPKVYKHSSRLLEEFKKSQVPCEKRKETGTVNEVEEIEEQNPTLDIKFTYYTARCEGCIGITKTGYDVRNTIYYKGMRVIAVDPNVIPLYSIVQFELDGELVKAIALDTGGAIKGSRIDLLVKTKKEAFQRGVDFKTVEILRYGE